MKLVFATANPNKVREVNQILGGELDLISLKEIGCKEEIPETQPTIEGNAIQKAMYVYEKYGVDCFAEDTGLEVEALDGEPGVRTARYAGNNKDPQANMDLILERLSHKENRKAQFKTVIALILGGKLHTCEGIATGKITKEKFGMKGFGYDPIFKADGFEKTFAEMSKEEKNLISHRAKALEQLRKILNHQNLHEK